MKVGMASRFLTVPYSVLIAIVAVDTGGLKCVALATWEQKISGFKVRAVLLGDFPHCHILLKRPSWISIDCRKKEDPPLFALQGLHNLGPA